MIVNSFNDTTINLVQFPTLQTFFSKYEFKGFLDDIEEEKLIELEKELYEKVTTECDFTFEINTKEYRFIDSNIIDDKFEEAIEEYIDEVILPEIPKQWHGYFDIESFISDAKLDGYCNAFAFYDGKEHNETFSEIDDEDTQSSYDFYYFRTN